MDGHFPGDASWRLVLSFAGPEPDTEIQEWIHSGIVAGVVLFADNFVSVHQLTESIALLKEAGGPAFHVMIDEEGGRVRRLPLAISPMLSISTYGADNAAAQAAADYARVCHTLKTLGINTLLAPVADVRTPHNTWLADRTFSDSPQAVADFAVEAVRAIQGAGLSACAKHFPGLGGVHDDLHARQFVVDDQADEIERRDLLPFRAAIRAGVEMVMISHAVYRALDSARPAVFSPVIIDGLLKKRLEFSGLVLCDDLAMGAIAKTMPIEAAVEAALQAGCDLVLVCRNRPLQRRAVRFLLQQVK